ncbi:MAG: aspartate aminotransferase family protein [Balneolaceae bacterium]|nr:aspartate aminotransferase family protein [Balneolaceae bacterium]
MDARETTDRFHLDVYGRYPVTLERGEGAWVWDTDSNRYLDALAGIAVNSLGHCHPAVVEAVRRQAGRLMHISNFYYSRPQAELCRRLAGLTGLDRVFLCNSGGEAMEGALKLARLHGRKHGKEGPVITLENAFHGRTVATISMGMEKYAEGFGPLLPGFRRVPLNDAAALEEAMDGQTPALVVEVVQGSGGLHTATGDYLRLARTLCDRHGALLVVDEVQTGVGRTGKMFAWQHSGIRPDIVALAKAMGGGFPVGAFAATEEAASAMDHGAHGSTFGGNPLACAAANAALQAAGEQDLAGAAAEKGRWLRGRIDEELGPTGLVREVRGMGLMLGVALSFPGRDVVEGMLRRGVLSNCTQGNVIRLVPPLVISQVQLEILADVLAASVREAGGRQTEERES